MAAIRLRRATSKPLFEKLRDWLRSPEERLERHLTERFSRAKSIADGVVPEPQWLLNERQAKSKLALQASATWFAKNDAWAAVASHKEKKNWWAYTPWGWRAWSRKNAHLVAAASSATKRHELVRKRRQVAQRELEAAENRWKHDPERRAIEQTSSEAKFDALRELKLVSEIRKMCREMPSYRSRPIRGLIEEAVERLRRQDYEQKLNWELKHDEPTGARPGW